MNYAFNHQQTESALDLSVLSMPSALKQEIGEALLRALPIDSISLLPLSSSMRAEELRAVFPNGTIYACDFDLQGAESQWPTAGGFFFPEFDIYNIDHHANHPSMFQQISSVHLAIEHVLKHGIAPLDSHVVIHHTDFDSTVSALIMRGLLPPHPDFAAGALAMDHTGEFHPLGDLVQALDVKRDITFSAEALARVLAGDPLDSSARRLLTKFEKERAATATYVAEGKIQWFERVALAIADQPIRCQFLRALLPDAAVCIAAFPPSEDKPWRMRVRLGQGAPQNVNLFSLGITREIDPHYKGRWNAGSNARSNGTTIAPDVYARGIAKLLTKANR